MPKQKRPVCDGNCFACPYPDCICEDPPKQEERTLAREMDRAAAAEDMTREAARLAAAKKAYRESHRDYYLNYMRAYRRRIKEATHEA